jgi:lipoprotein-anchoring transpeptidase ErfK/SrfK
LKKRDSYPSVADGNRKWIDVSINDQTLVAYEGTKAVYVTLVSTGIAGLADPEKAPATVRGTFMVHAKHVTATMDGDEDVADSFSLRDVPFVQYFHKGYALHGAYWHDEFGKVRSHGCINLAPVDAAWLFEWTDPPVPAGWHAALNSERGTAINIHP